MSDIRPSFSKPLSHSAPTAATAIFKAKFSVYYQTQNSTARLSAKRLLNNGSSLPYNNQPPTCQRYRTGPCQLLYLPSWTKPSLHSGSPLSSSLLQYIRGCTNLSSLGSSTSVSNLLQPCYEFSLFIHLKST